MIADLAIGAPFSSYSGTVSGTSYVIFGKSGAFSSPVLLTGNPAFINHLDGSNGFQLTGASSAEQSGWAVAGAGDINGDGADDLLVGARLASGFDGTSVLTNSGKVYVFYGQSSDRLAPVTSLSRTPAANPFGWNNASVAISLAATDETGGSGLLETRCVSDPLAIPAGFNDLPISACGPISFTSEGAHSFYAASVDRAGNQETPVSLAVKIDLTAPVVGVTGVKQGAVYRRGRVPATGCSTRDALSGVASNAVLTVTGGNSRGLGQFTASCSGALDQANNQGSAVVTYSVR